VKTESVDFCDVDGVESDFNFNLNGEDGVGNENDLDVDKMKEFMREILVWAKKCEEVKLAHASALATPRVLTQSSIEIFYGRFRGRLVGSGSIFVALRI